MHHGMYAFDAVATLTIKPPLPHCPMPYDRLTPILPPCMFRLNRGNKLVASTVNATVNVSLVYYSVLIKHFVRLSEMGVGDLTSLRWLSPCNCASLINLSGL